MKRKKVNPTINALFEAYLRRDDVKVELDLQCGQIEDLVFIVKENDEEKLRVEVPEDLIGIFAVPDHLLRSWKRTGCNYVAF